MDDHGVNKNWRRSKRWRMSNLKQRVEKARDRRTTRSWKIKFSSMHGVRCPLMHARVLLKPPRGIGKGSKINTSALWQSIPIDSTDISVASRALGEYQANVQSLGSLLGASTQCTYKWNRGVRLCVFSFPLFKLCTSYCII